MKNLNNIFEPTACLSEEMMIAYVKDKLSVEEKYAAEKHLNACPLCSDELDGLTAMNKPEELPLYIERINNRIDARIRPRRIIPLARIKPFMSVAAAIILLVGIGYFIKISLFDSAKDMSLAEHKSSEKSDEAYMPESASEEAIVRDEEIREAVDIVPEERENEDKDETINENVRQDNELVETITTDDAVILDKVEKNSETDLEHEEEPSSFATGSKIDSGTEVKEEKQPVAVSEIQKRIAADSKNQQNQSDEQLAETEASEEKEISFFGTTRSNRNIASRTNDAAALEKNYEEAVKAYRNDNHEKAKKLLDEIISNKGLHQYDALWYRGLIYKAEGETEKAQANFKRVAESNTKFSKEARKELE